MSKFYNRTRTSRSIPRKLLREGKPYLLPLYYLLLTSELASEGIRNSGSYRFADHIYAGKPKGKFLIGLVLDAIFLRMKSARSFRARYIYAKREIHKFVQEAGHGEEGLDILAVPCGLAREMFEVAQELRDAGDPMYPRIKWHGLDLDGELVSLVARQAVGSGHDMLFLHGDALLGESYPQKYDMIISLGFGEFLDDEKLVEFYKLVGGSLKPDGVFVTSGLMPHPFSDYLLRNIGELHTFYRPASLLMAQAKRAGLRVRRVYHDKTGLQTMLVSVRS